MSVISNYYDDRYFARQRLRGEFAGWACLAEFESYISAEDDVLDFGCGGGYLLKNIRCRKRVGVEVNPSAAAVAKENGVEVYARVEDVPNDYVDIIISNNALEHTLFPLRELKTLYAKLRNAGRVVLVVPCESIGYAYRAGDGNHHLYSWSPMCLGNLLAEAGFSVVESKPYIHKWPPKYRFIARIGGRRAFDIACRVYGRIERSWFQVRAVAEKPNPSRARLERTRRDELHE